jgi:hypothetical protein
MKESENLKNLGVNGRIILTRVLNKEDARTWSGFISLRTQTTCGLFEHGNETWGFMKCGNVLTS